MAKYFRTIDADRRQAQEDFWHTGTYAYPKKRERKDKTQDVARLPADVAKGFNGGQRQGHEAEERFHSLFRSRAHTLSWLHKIEWATIAEEKSGIDIVVHTNENFKIPLQIKSSLAGLLKFRRRPERRHICCIVVASTCSDERIWENFLEEITFVRDAMLLVDRHV